MKKKDVKAVDPADVAAAEEALLRRAVGYKVVETRKTEVGAGEAMKSQTVTTEKHVPPDVRALIFFLKNRVPDKWREKEKVGDVERMFEAGEDPFVEALRAVAERVWGERRGE